MNVWSPLGDSHHSGCHQHIAEMPSAEQAFLFHTHQGTLRVARQLAYLAGRSLNVVKVL
jgi:hypothetical protein